MARCTRPELPAPGPSGLRVRRSGSLLAALMSTAVLATACSLVHTARVPQSPAAGSAATGGASAGSGQTQVQGGIGGGGGGGGLPGGPGRGQSYLYSGRFSAALTRCMRANGVPAFPYSDGSAHQLQTAGLDIHSAQFQAALYGPCKLLAPAAWVSVPPLGPPPSGPAPQGSP